MPTKVQISRQGRNCPAGVATSRPSTPRGRIAHRSRRCRRDGVAGWSGPADQGETNVPPTAMMPRRRAGSRWRRPGRRILSVQVFGLLRPLGTSNRPGGCRPPRRSRRVVVRASSVESMTSDDGSSISVAGPGTTTCRTAARTQVVRMPGAISSSMVSSATAVTVPCRPGRGHHPGAGGQRICIAWCPRRLTLLLAHPEIHHARRARRTSGSARASVSMVLLNLDQCPWSVHARLGGCGRVTWCPREIGTIGSGVPVVSAGQCAGRGMSVRYAPGYRNRDMIDPGVTAIDSRTPPSDEALQPVEQRSPRLPAPRRGRSADPGAPTRPASRPGRVTVRAIIPTRTRNGSHTSSTVLGSSPTCTASVLSPTGPPPNERHSALSTERSSRSRPSSSTS